ncbi:pyocin activator PrtN family protein [Pseudomonas sp. S9]|uniref:pyocin activator PrtN family protein n=1 Tax=Pseudomonas sp. S9 TaxID=686578 RepID=UPI0002556FDF|nr:pyocin activator PrtN family protein [Pseudomonas sp. S9]
MNTSFLLMAQYNGAVIIPLERVCADYFSHLTPEKMKIKVAAGQIDLPLVPIERSQKSARGVHLSDLAAYLDAQHSKAKAEHDKLMGRGSRRAS